MKYNHDCPGIEGELEVQINIDVQQRLLVFLRDIEYMQAFISSWYGSDIEESMECGFFSYMLWKVHNNFQNISYSLTSFGCN